MAAKKTPETLITEAKDLLAQSEDAKTAGAKTSKVQAAVNRLNQHPQVRISPDLGNLPMVKVMVNMAREINVFGKRTKAEAVVVALTALGSR